MKIFILLAATLVRNTESHGFLKSPRSRNLVAAQEGVWSGGTSSTYPKETCPHCLNRGGVLAECGMTDGRSYDANLSILGEPMPPAPQAQFSEGEEIDLEVVLTAHHKGHFEFFACPLASGEVPTEACFQQYPLTFVSDPLYGAPVDTSYPTRAYIAPIDVASADNDYEVPGDFYRFRFKLPSNLSGDLVLLQWRYYTANSCTYPGYSSYPFPSDWGNMQDGLSECTNIPPDGNGYPEQFWNCAEISISGGGPVSLPSSAPPNPPSPISAPVSPPSPITAPASPSSPNSAPISPPSPNSAPISPSSPISATTSPTSPSADIEYCGNGSTGNGICADSLLCCSQWGHCGTGPEYCASAQQFSSSLELLSSLRTPTFSPNTDSLQGCCSLDLATCDFDNWCSSSEVNCAQCRGFYIYPLQQIGCLPIWNKCESTSQCCGHAKCVRQRSGKPYHCILPENQGFEATPTSKATWKHAMKRSNPSLTAKKNIHKERNARNKPIKM